MTTYRKYFIRYSTACTIARRMQYLHEPLETACREAVTELFDGGGMGGVVALDDEGNGSSPFRDLLPLSDPLYSSNVPELPWNVPWSY